ncbi:MAG: hypothetical protein C0594_14955 [Marinilabiliales bacterium]|nr:MAG: hypothetical protein C0594_14955 [Marinilabiliales bacterium]
MRRILIVLALLVYIGQLSAQEEVKKDTVYADDSVDVEYSAMPVITISASDLESDQESQDISGLLSASRDPFVSTAGYTFGPARYRIRGYDSENTLVTINGLIANDVESGRAYW